MQRLYRVLSYFIFGLNGLLIFFWFYHEQLVAPPWVQSFGRMHPMLLHLPIGFFVLAVVLLFIKNQFKRKAFNKTFQLIIFLTAFTLVLTALMGIVLSLEGGYEDDILSKHLNLGVVLSFVVAAMTSFDLKDNFTTVFYGLTGTGFIFLLITGHYGATLTHGNNYVLGPLMKGNKVTNLNQDSITAFTKAISPIFEKKCISCHNPQKKKGELILIDEANILKGGEDGIVIISGSPQESELIKRIHLELEHDDHMPPSGKPQLTANEIKLLEYWIESGADFSRIWNSYPETDTFKLLSTPVLLAYQKPEKVAYDFDFASSEKIKSLNTPFRNVSQLYADAPALKANFYLAQYYKPQDLKDLSDVKSQLLELNLSSMPVDDADADVLVQFKNLEDLNLNNTNVTDKTIEKIIALPRLKKLSLVGTKVTTQSLPILEQSKSLVEVFVWNTAIKHEEVTKSEKRDSQIIFNFGFEGKENEILKLTPPILKNESFLLGDDDAIILKHNLPGTIIRYSVDGTTPDSVNAIVYFKPIHITNNATLKTLATKEGWFKSNTLEYNFYKKGLQPSSAKLLTITNKDYKAKGSKSLIDNTFGDPNNFRDGNWLGFRESKFEAEFNFDQEMPLNEISILYGKNIGSYLMPPQEVEVWAGASPLALKLIKKLNPTQPDKYESNKLEAVTIALDSTYKTIKIIGSPVSKLPSWHSGKGEKGWLMISEVIFK